MRPAHRTLLAMSLLLAGCSGIEDPLSGRERRELVSARARWNSSPVRAAYRYELRQSCFCPPEITNWNTITVIDGVVIDVRNDRGEQVSRDRWTWYATVDQLFARLEVNGAHELLEDITVRFDTQYGYPVEMTFEYGPNIADAGASYSARNLQAVLRTGS